MTTSVLLGLHADHFEQELNDTQAFLSGSFAHRVQQTVPDQTDRRQPETNTRGYRYKGSPYRQDRLKQIKRI